MKPIKHHSIFWVLSSMVLLLFLAYLYMINSVIFDAASRQNKLVSVNKVQMEVASLEAVYLEKTGKITLNLAKELGFEDATAQTVFVKTN